MKFTKVLTIASLLCTATAAMALPSQAAPFFGTATNNNSCGNGFVGYNHVPYTGAFAGGRRLHHEERGIAGQIQNGVANGRLTPGEANRLMRDDARLRGLQSRLAYNGLNPIERARLNADANRLEWKVRKDEHNRRFW